MKGMSFAGSRGSARRRLMAGMLCAGAAVTGTGVTAHLFGGGWAPAGFGPWKPPVSAEQGSSPELNTASNDGCPILSPDGLSLYMASNRPGGLGGQDIWVAKRATVTSGWGAPVNLGAPINSAVDDFCPTPVIGKGLFFVTRRTEPNGDIYFARRNRDGQWEEPIHLGPNINSPDQEWSPSFFFDAQGRAVLYFGSTRPGGPGQQDIYYSINFGPAQLAPGNLNTPYNDARPNVRSDGLEIVFDSDRPGTLGATDIFTASRPSTSKPWPAATHLADLSSPAGDSRASLSWDGSMMVFGSARAGGEGMADIYVTTRRNLTKPHGR